MHVEVPTPVPSIAVPGFRLFREAVEQDHRRPTDVLFRAETFDDAIQRRGHSVKLRGTDTRFNLAIIEVKDRIVRGLRVRR